MWISVLTICSITPLICIALLVEAPVLIEVSAGAESAKPQHGFGASEGPTRSGEVYAVRDQVAAGAFDHAGSDRESSGEALVVVDPTLAV